MKFVYIGTAAGDRDLDTVFSKTARTKIVYVQQKWDYIFYKAMEACEDGACCVSYPPVQTFPAGKRIYTKRMPIHGLKRGVYIPTLNLPVIKQAGSVLRVLRELKRIGKNDDLTIITHTLYLQSLLAAQLYKRRHPDTRIVSLVPDLPDFANEDTRAASKLDRFLFRAYKKLSLSVKGKVDGYVCFSRWQMERLDPSKPFMVMEGFSIGTPSAGEDAHKEEGNGKVFLYAGNLQRDSGVLDFARAFAQASLPDAQLWICGEGEQRAEIEALGCPAIRLLGILPREEVLRLERQACVLVNPRPVQEAYAKYSFPSKNMEYMVSGTPLLTTNLPGMPAEYRPYVYLVEEDTADGIRAALERTFSHPLSERREKGRAARAFVLGNKTNLQQAKKLLDSFCKDPQNLLHMTGEKSGIVTVAGECPAK